MMVESGSFPMPQCVKVYLQQSRIVYACMHTPSEAKAGQEVRITLDTENIGEASGTIPKTLDKLAFYLEQQASFRSTVVSGIIYPAILFTVSIGAIAFFALVVGPKFQSIFDSMGVELPWITRTLLAFFDFLKKNFLRQFIGSFPA